MKFFALLITPFLFVSCFNCEPFPDNLPDDSVSMIDEGPDIDVEYESETTDDFAVSVSSRGDYGVFNDIVIGDTLGNVYYSDIDEKGEKTFTKITRDGDFVWETTFSFPLAEYFSLYTYAFAEESESLYLTGWGQFDDIGVKLFLIKINLAGSVDWIKKWGTGDRSIPHAIGLDSEENIYVAGAVWGTFDGETAGECSDNRCDDAFVTKWDQYGNHIWTKQSGEYGSDVINGVAVDRKNNLHLVGNKTVRTTTGPPNYDAKDEMNMFLAIWDADGNEIDRVTDYNAETPISAKDVKMLDDGIVVFGSRGVTLSDGKSSLLYLRKYLLDGTFVWETLWSPGGAAEHCTVANSNIYTVATVSPGTIMATIFDKDGSMITSQIMPSSCSDYPSFIIPLTNKSLMITGMSDGWVGDDFANAECTFEEFEPFVMLLTPF